MRPRLAWCAVGLLVLVLMVGTQIPGLTRDMLERSLHAPFPLSSLAHFLLFVGMAWLLASRPIAWPVARIGAGLLGLALLTEGLQVFAGASWTTDAPFRETAAAIARARALGVLAVEMEAAALYAFARARDASVLCLAHVTNAMGQGWQDFEKGEADGTADALKIMQVVIKAVRSRSKGPSHTRS